jgi:hypothetical protein
MKDEGRENFPASLTSRSLQLSRFRLPRTLEILLALAVLLELIAPFTTKTYGVDGRLQVNMIDQFTRLVSEGVLIPRWVPDGFHGFGAASFYFYPPVMLYVASVFRLLFSLTDPYALYQMTGLTATVASFFTARILLKSIAQSKYQINMGALLFAFAPFRLADLYGRSNLATHVAYVFIPLVWYGLIEIVRQKNSRHIKRIVQLGISSALLALTNVPAVLATSVCIGIAAIVVRKQLTLHAATAAATAAVIAAGLCAFHFFAAIALGPFAYLSSLDGGDPQFFLLHLFEKSSIPALYYIILLYAAVAIIIWSCRNMPKSNEVTSETEKMALNIGLAIVALTIYLEIPYISLPVWRYIPVFKLIQFGWRFYTHFVLFAAVIVAVALSVSMLRVAKGIVWAWTLGVLGPAILIVFSLHIFEHSSRPLEDAIEYRPIYTKPDDNFIARLPKEKAIFFAVTDEMNRVYVPRQAEPPAATDFQDGERIARKVSKPYLEEYDATLHGSREVTFHRFYWPAWHLYVDDRSSTVDDRSSTDDREIMSRPDSIGRATATLPQGHYKIRWRLEKTPLESAGFWISRLTLCGIALAAVTDLFRRRKRSRSSRNLRHPQTGSDTHSQE